MCGRRDVRRPEDVWDEGCVRPGCCFPIRLGEQTSTEILDKDSLCRPGPSQTEPKAGRVPERS